VLSPPLAAHAYLLCTSGPQSIIWQFVFNVFSEQCRRKVSFSHDNELAQSANFHTVWQLVQYS
jgi:hypothetical protein